MNKQWTTQKESRQCVDNKHINSFGYLLFCESKIFFENFYRKGSPSLSLLLFCITILIFESWLHDIWLDEQDELNHSFVVFLKAFNANSLWLIWKHRKDCYFRNPQCQIGSIWCKAIALPNDGLESNTLLKRSSCPSHSPITLPLRLHQQPTLATHLHPIL